MVLKVLVLFSPFILQTKWTGAARRLCEILKRGKSVGVQYIVAFDKKSFSAITKYPRVSDALKPYNVYFLDLSPPNHNRFFRGFFRIVKAAFTLNKIAKEEKIDLILSTSEADWMSLEAYITSKLSGKPWTSIWQPTDHLLEPSQGIGAITPFNVFQHINSKPDAKKNSFKTKVAQALTLLTQLKLAEKTLTLSVSQSVINSARILNPKSNFHAINPGNGVFLKHCSTELATHKFQAVFFARLVPEKGFYDIPLIWKQVVKRFPKAKLAITGITIDPKIVQTFNSLVRENSLTKNIVFLGELPESELIKTVESSSLTVYPSVLDAFCLVALESLACGTPVVAYDIPALQENYGKCSAVLLSPKRSISDIVSNIMFLLENEDLRLKLKEAARSFANSHDWDAVAKSEKEAYYKVISWKSKEKSYLEI